MLKVKQKWLTSALIRLVCGQSLGNSANFI